MPVTQSATIASGFVIDITLIIRSLFDESSKEMYGLLLRLDRLDKRLHVPEILLQRPAPGRRETILGARNPSVERLLARDVVRLL